APGGVPSVPIPAAARPAPSAPGPLGPSAPPRPPYEPGGPRGILLPRADVGRPLSGYYAHTMGTGPLGSGTHFSRTGPRSDLPVVSGGEVGAGRLFRILRVGLPEYPGNTLQAISRGTEWWLVTDELTGLTGYTHGYDRIGTPLFDRDP